MEVQRISTAPLTPVGVRPANEALPLAAQIAAASAPGADSPPRRSPPYPVRKLSELLEEWVRYRVLMQRWNSTSVAATAGDEREPLPLLGSIRDQTSVDDLAPPEVLDGSIASGDEYARSGVAPPGTLDRERTPTPTSVPPSPLPSLGIDRLA